MENPVPSRFDLSSEIHYTEAAKVLGHPTHGS